MFRRSARNPANIILIMATTALRFTLPRTKIPSVYALLEADDTPPCELKIKKANKGMHEIEIITDTTNAGYFRKALGGGEV